jgi:hypothetical protein
MAITSERLAGMSVVITGRNDSPQAALDRDRARVYQERARELREERSRLIEEREKQQRHQMADRLHELGNKVRSGETSRADSAKREEEDREAKTGGRKEGSVEMTDAKQAKLAKFAETEAAYARHDAARQQQRDHGGGGRGGR